MSSSRFQVACAALVAAVLLVPHPAVAQAVTGTISGTIVDQQGTHYLNTDRGMSANYTKIIRSNLVSDTDFGIRQQTEQFYPLTQGDWDRINRDNVGFDVGQFSPQLNPRNVIPKVNFNVPNSPNFTYDNRLVDQGEGWLTSVRSNLPWIRDSHSIKGGIYLEQSRNSEGSGGVGAGPWSGEYFFNTDTSNPFDTNWGW